VTLEDFQKTKEEIEEEQRKLAAKTAAAAKVYVVSYANAPQADIFFRAQSKPKKKKKKERSKLSFMDDEDDDASGSAGEKRPREDDGESPALCRTDSRILRKKEAH
jgi:protein FAM50